MAGLDLAGLDLTGLDLADFDLGGLDLAGLDLAGLGFEIYHKNSITDLLSFQIFCMGVHLGKVYPNVRFLINPIKQSSLTNLSSKRVKI